MSKALDFESGNLTRLFAKFAIPSIVGLLVISLQIVVDGYFVSLTMGEVGLASVNLASPLMAMIVSVDLMIVCGGVVIAGIARGDGHEGLSRGYTTLTMLVQVLVLLLITAALVLGIDRVCHLLGAQADTMPYVRKYLFVMISGSIIYCMPIFTEGFARLIGKPNMVFVSGVVGLSTNALLDYVFLVRWGWGIEGAAYATLIACAAQSLALMPIVKFGRLRGGWNDVGRMLYNGSSEMLSVVSSAIATYYFNRVLMERIGTMGVAAMTVVLYINSLLNLSLFGLAQAMQPLIAYNVGARRYDRIKKLLMLSLKVGGAIGWITYVLIHLWGDGIIEAFTQGNESLYALTKTAAGFVTLHYLLSFVNIVAGSLHTSIERPLESALIALCRSVVFMLIPLYLLPLVIGNTGIWLSMPIAELATVCVSVPLLVISMRRLKRKLAA